MEGDNRKNDFRKVGRVTEYVKSGDVFTNSLDYQSRDVFIHW